jgi:uncharacterized protein YbjT (DUF2867 family)
MILNVLPQAASATSPKIFREMPQSLDFRSAFTDKPQNLERRKTLCCPLRFSLPAAASDLNACLVAAPASGRRLSVGTLRKKNEWVSDAEIAAALSEASGKRPKKIGKRPRDVRGMYVSC